MSQFAAHRFIDPLAKPAPAPPTVDDMGRALWDLVMAASCSRGASDAAVESACRRAVELLERGAMARPAG